jgi:RNA polymerase sigma factor (sigma-70 family)
MAVAPAIGRATGVGAPAAAPGSLAAHALYERHADRVFAYCAYHLRDRNEADDALQTTFMHALQALRRGVVPEIELAWLLSIARNVCLTRWDADRRRSQLEVARDPHVLQEVGRGRESEGEELFRLQEALEAMPERERRAILLREWQGLSYREVAAELGLSQSAVETLIFRARRALADGLRGVPAPNKRRAALGLDLGSLLGALKSLLGGAVVKVAVGAAVVAATVSVGTFELKGERPTKAPSPPTRTVPTAPAPPQEAFDWTRPPAPHPSGPILDGALGGSSEHPGGNSGNDLDSSGAQAGHNSGGSELVASVPTVPAVEPGGAPSLGDLGVPIVEQVAPTVLPVVAEVAPAVLPAIVEAQASVLQAGELVSALSLGPPIVSLP